MKQVSGVSSLFYREFVPKRESMGEGVFHFYSCDRLAMPFFANRKVGGKPIPVGTPMRKANIDEVTIPGCDGDPSMSSGQ
jgi:hypothetical protein